MDGMATGFCADWTGYAVFKRSGSQVWSTRLCRQAGQLGAFSAAGKYRSRLYGAMPVRIRRGEVDVSVGYDGVSGRLQR